MKTIKQHITCKQCGACCIGLSISSTIPGLENGKPAGVVCIHLNADNLCSIYEIRPKVCKEYSPSMDICGNSHEEALENMRQLEAATSCN